MVTMVSSRSGSLSAYNSLDLDDVQTPASDYSAYSQGNLLSAANGHFLYSQTAHTDLNGSVWDTPIEGTQDYHGEEDFHFQYGHITPRGQDQNEALDDMTSKWIVAEQAMPAAAEPMKRISSRASSGSSKSRTIKASSHKSRPRLISTMSQGSHVSDFNLTSHPMEGYLLQDDARSVASSTMYYPTLISNVGLPMDGMPTDGLSYSPTLLQQHVDPLQMQLKFDPSVAGNSPLAAWSPPSPMSRNSSPDMHEDMWSNSVPMDASPTHTDNSSPIMDGTSPSLDRQMGLMSTEDPNGLIPADEMFALPPSYARRSSGDGESSARIHPLYKNANPGPDGLFHCPWEGQASCTHKAEKLKCNYDKFVDSHLKPYRCKVDACENARFSSTACLLRHEREAHAMHGHGDKPFLCTYEGCERAMNGNGFPRQWNLRDHMRRVHNDNGSSLNTDSSPNGLGSSSSKGRKRKSKDLVESASSTRKQASKSAQAAEAAAAARAAEVPLNEEWFQHRKALEDFMQSYTAPDAFDYIQNESAAAEHLEHMFKISKKLKHRRAHRHHAHHSG